MTTTTIATGRASSPTCDVDGCPGRGEGLDGCRNPDHPDDLDALFHRQRDGHGVKRRGKPRIYCSDQCSRYVNDNYYVSRGVPTTRKVRVWTVPWS
jgi:hypothetical protein